VAVLIRIEREFPDGQVHAVPTLLPTGRAIPKDERERAERLDAFLGTNIPLIVGELRGLDLLESNDLKKWHALGTRLQFVDDVELVSHEDRDSGIIWLAVRQYCPVDLLPRGEKPLTPHRLREELSNLDRQRRLAKKHDHFERCYKLGKYELGQVSWMTWSDFDTFLESPGLERDARILPAMADRASQLDGRVTRSAFRVVCKVLREAIPTKNRQRDTTLMTDQELSKLVDHAFEAAGRFH
jgi:hypothetical protein